MLVIGYIRATVFIGVLAAVGSALAQELRFIYFSVPGSDFVVAMPGNPRSVSDNTGPKGVIGRVYLSETSKAAFFVDYAFVPRGAIPDTVSPQQYLDRMVSTTSAKGKDGKARNERRFDLANAKAAEVILDMPVTPPQVVKVGLYVRRDRDGNMRTYQLTVSGNPGSETDPDVLRFFQSVKLD